MKLNEMGIFGHKVKVADTAPRHAGLEGKLVTAAQGRSYVEFANGDKEWVENKHILGTKRDESINEMAKPVQTCSKCGLGPMSKTHHWYQGGWKCKKGGGTKDDAPAAASKDPFPEMTDAVYDKLSAADQAKQDAKEKDWYKRNGRDEPKDYEPEDANEKAATERAMKLRKKLET